MTDSHQYFYIYGEKDNTEFKDSFNGIWNEESYTWKFPSYMKSAVLGNDPICSSDDDENYNKEDVIIATSSNDEESCELAKPVETRKKRYHRACSFDPDLSSSDEEL